MELHGENIVDCPELIFKEGKYWCKLIESNHELLKDMPEGCGVPWNRWRKDIRKRTREEYKEYYDNDLLTDLVSAYNPIKHMKKRKK
jgi:hypothetical protein